MKAHCERKSTALHEEKLSATQELSDRELLWAYQQTDPESTRADLLHAEMIRRNLNL